MESNRRGDDRFRGRSGALLIGEPAWRNELSEAYVAAAKAAGLPENPDFNGAQQEGVGYCHSPPATDGATRRPAPF